jgi:hypothetical protein
MYECGEEVEEEEEGVGMLWFDHRADAVQYR